MESRGRIKIFANDSGKKFGNKVTEELTKYIQQFDGDATYRLSDLETRIFADSELIPRIDDSVRGADVYLIQQPFNPEHKNSVQDNVMETLFTIHALRNANARFVTLINPLHPYSRQDKSRGREPIGMMTYANLLKTVKVNNVLSFDLHSDQSIGFYDQINIHIDNLRASNILFPKIKEILGDDNSNLVVMAPDAGGVPRAKFYADNLNSELAFATKRRSPNESNIIDSLEVSGNFKDKDILIVDDMVDTGGSVIKLYKALKEKKAKKVRIVAVHPLLNINSKVEVNPIDVFPNLGIELITTDTVYRSDNFLERNSKWYHQVSVSPIVAKAIFNLNTNQSLSTLYRENVYEVK